MFGQIFRLTDTLFSEAASLSHLTTLEALVINTNIVAVAFRMFVASGCRCLVFVVVIFICFHTWYKIYVAYRCK